MNTPTGLGERHRLVPLIGRLFTPADCERREPVVAGTVRPFVLLRGGAS